MTGPTPVRTARTGGGGRLVAAAPATHPEPVQWLAPAPVWDAAPGRSAALSAPRLVELDADSFVEAFLDVVGGRTGRPDELAAMAPRRSVGTGAAAAYRLYHPLSRRYYLVTATLVCRRPGIPDHRIRKDETVSFVVRRVAKDGTESAFLPGRPHGVWVPATPYAVSPGEQEHALHEAPVAGFAEPGTLAAALGMAAPGPGLAAAAHPAAGRGVAARSTNGAGPAPPSHRRVLFGYVPVAQRDAYTPPVSAAELAAALADATAAQPAGTVPHPALDELSARVIGPWTGIRSAGSGAGLAYPSLFVLLDLSDWLRTHLPRIHAATLGGTSLASGSAAEALRAALAGASVKTADPGPARALDRVLADLEPFAPLVRGQDIAGPAGTHDLRGPLPAAWLAGESTPGSLLALASAALVAEGVSPRIPPELEGLITLDPPVSATELAAGLGPTYVIRCVFRRPPCRDVLSEPTHAFELARPVDADAPARPIRIPLPDITGLRSFQRGVAFEMPPSLRAVMDRVTPDMLKGSGLGPGSPELKLGMICAFSLQIIFLVAFVVMFIFLLLLNIVFWWLPFLKICFPIPVPAKSPKGPQP